MQEPEILEPQALHAYGFWNTLALADKGFFFECILLSHCEGERSTPKPLAFGNGRPMSVKEIAKLAHTTKRTAERILRRLIDAKLIVYESGTYWYRGPDFSDSFGIRRTNNGDPSGYVYILRYEDLYKIGQSLDPKRRLAQLQFPFDTELLLVFGVDDRRKSEELLHHHFAEKRRKGEWFKLNKDDLAAIEVWAKNGHIPDSCED